jgi:hypothetical protein
MKTIAPTGRYRKGDSYLKRRTMRVPDGIDD